MKKLLIAIAFVALTAATAANAQAFGMRITVPFQFYAGDGVHPAGDYVVHVNKTFRVVELSAIKTAGNGWAPLKWVPVPRKSEGAPGRLVFTNYGNGAYVLRSVWIAGSDGYELKPSKVEAELARKSGAESLVVSTQ